MQLINADCFEAMQALPEGYVDLLLTDPPYTITYAEWDIPIDWSAYWRQAYRVCKPNAAIIMFACSKFTIELAYSNLKDYRYKYVWDKRPNGTGFLNAKKMPMHAHEDVLVFYRKLPTYNPQWRYKHPYFNKGCKPSSSTLYRFKGNKGSEQSIDGRRYPVDIISFNKGNGCRLHPTQKPTSVLDFLIRTYTNEGGVVLDTFAGSGSTGASCINCGRNFIGVEKDPHYFAVMQERLNPTALGLA